MDDIVFDAKSAAAFFGVSMPTLYAWLRRENHPLPSMRVGGHGYRILKSRAIAWINEESEMQ